MAATEESRNDQTTEEENSRPFIAPCRQLDTKAPLRWVKQGFADYRRAPTLSILYGAVMVSIGWLISAWAWHVGSFTLLIMLFAGFVFLGPALAMGIYSVSCQLDKGVKPQIGFCLTQGRKRFGNQMIFAFVLLVVFLVWARAAAMVNIFLPMSTAPDFMELLKFFVIGSAIGTVFAVVIFCASAFSLPMIMDRDVDAITAMLTSFNAVLKNKKPMFLWAMIILASTLIGFLTLYAAFLFTLPIIGYASWRGYRETIVSDEWPQDPDTAA